MGKQSARLIFRGKDHKDIYFQGKYCNALYVCKDDTTPELYWRKLYDEGYFVYGFSTFSPTVPYIAIMYPEYKIREYITNFVSTTLYHSNNLFVRFDATLIPMRLCWISEDGKLWKKTELGDLGTAIRGVVPKGDGIVVGNALDNYGRTMEYTYYPVKDCIIDKKNPVKLYSDSEHGTQTSGSIYNYANITDILILYDNYEKIAFALDMNGKIYNNLFPVVTGTGDPSEGCFNGMYWVVDRLSYQMSYNSYSIQAYVSTNPYSGEWERKTFFNTNTYYRCVAIQAKEYIALYFVHQYGYAMQAYTTKDFNNFQQIDIPDNLLVPFIGETWSEDIKYVNIMLSPNAESRSDSLNYNFLTSYSSADIFQGNLNYVENQKISPFKGLLLQVAGQGSTVTIYIDNLFFKESENNFAIYERNYPEQYMNDYMEES